MVTTERPLGSALAIALGASSFAILVALKRQHPPEITVTADRVDEPVNSAASTWRPARAASAWSRRRTSVMALF
jgi:hypothetical protein